MESKILKCCGNKSKFLIHYEAATRYFVCEGCFLEKIWSSGIKSKQEVSV